MTKAKQVAAAAAVDAAKETGDGAAEAKEKEAKRRPRTFKIYRGFVPIDEQRVYVTTIADASRNVPDDPKAYKEKDRLKHHKLHSPDGFAWGYHGSGPAELARCILWDHLGEAPHPILYQKFKVDYVATWDSGAVWMVSSEAIDDWLERNKDIPRAA